MNKEPLDRSQYTSVGWIILDESGKPYRSTKSGYPWQHNLTNPPRVYSTEGKAKGLAKRINGSVKEVFYEV